jgi:hypothetical protein
VLTFFENKSKDEKLTVIDSNHQKFKYEKYEDYSEQSVENPFAIITFRSKNNYVVAELSTSYRQLENIYGGTFTRKKELQFADHKNLHISSKLLDKFEYQGIKRNMKGSPLFNNNGCLIGIHSYPNNEEDRKTSEPDTNIAISIKSFLENQEQVEPTPSLRATPPRRGIFGRFSYKRLPPTIELQLAKGMNGQPPIMFVSSLFTRSGKTQGIDRPVFALSD